jgi:hypothetical protein
VSRAEPWEAAAVYAFAAAFGNGTKLATEAMLEVLWMC